jgi:hypothetical protein
MALDHVRQLVGEHRRELGFVVELHEQADGDVDVALGQHEGVHVGAAQHVIVKGEVRGQGWRCEAGGDARYVGRDRGVRQLAAVGIDVGHHQGALRKQRALVCGRGVVASRVRHRRDMRRAAGGDGQEQRQDAARAARPRHFARAILDHGAARNAAVQLCGQNTAAQAQAATAGESPSTCTCLPKVGDAQNAVGEPLRKEHEEEVPLICICLTLRRGLCLPSPSH